MAERVAIDPRRSTPLPADTDVLSVAAAGRDPERLASLTKLGADATSSLAGDPDTADRAVGEAATDVDVVIDYLWGPATERTMPAVLTRADESHALTWIEIGSMSGPEITLPSAWLRAARLQIVRSGQGSLSTSDMISEFPALAHEISTGTYTITPSTPSQYRSARSRHLERTRCAPGQRSVFVP